MRARAAFKGAQQWAWGRTRKKALPGHRSGRRSRGARDGKQVVYLLAGASHRSGGIKTERNHGDSKTEH
jgi:hypothetical protein